MSDRFEKDNEFPLEFPVTFGQRKGIFARLETEGQTETIKVADGEVR